MATSLMNTEETTTETPRLHAFRITEKMRWDTTTIDKLLYIVNSIVLLVCGVVLMFIIKPLDAPHKSIKCWTPAEFRTEWNQYAEKYCLLPDAGLYEMQHDRYPMHYTEPRLEGEVFPAKPSNSNFTTSLFLMAFLSPLPILCWRLVGSFDGRDFLAKGGSSRVQGFLVMVWFLVTKVGTAALCALFVVLVTLLKGQGEEYLDAAEYNRQPADKSVLCDFRIRKLGQNMHRYTVQCVISKGQYDVSSVFRQMFASEHILGYMLNSLQIWLIVLLVVNVINSLTTAFFILSLSKKSPRINFIQQYVPAGTDMNACDKIDCALGSTGAIVFHLAVKLGYSAQVKNVLIQLCSYQN